MDDGPRILRPGDALPKGGPYSPLSRRQVDEARALQFRKLAEHAMNLEQQCGRAQRAFVEVALQLGPGHSALQHIAPLFGLSVDDFEAQLLETVKRQAVEKTAPAPESSGAP